MARINPGGQAAEQLMRRYDIGQVDLRKMDAAGNNDGVFQAADFRTFVEQNPASRFANPPGGVEIAPPPPLPPPAIDIVTTPAATLSVIPLPETIVPADQQIVAPPEPVSTQTSSSVTQAPTFSVPQSDAGLRDLGQLQLSKPLQDILVLDDGGGHQENVLNSLLSQAPPGVNIQTMDVVDETGGQTWQRVLTATEDLLATPTDQRPDALQMALINPNETPTTAAIRQNLTQLANDGMVIVTVAGKTVDTTTGQTTHNTPRPGSGDIGLANRLADGSHPGIFMVDASDEDTGLGNIEFEGDTTSFASAALTGALSTISVQQNPVPGSGTISELPPGLTLEQINQLLMPGTPPLDNSGEFPQPVTFGPPVPLGLTGQQPIPLTGGTEQQSAETFGPPVPLGLTGQQPIPLTGGTEQQSAENFGPPIPLGLTGQQPAPLGLTRTSGATVFLGDNNPRMGPIPLGFSSQRSLGPTQMSPQLQALFSRVAQQLQALFGQ